MKKVLNEEVMFYDHKLTIEEIVGEMNKLYDGNRDMFKTSSYTINNVQQFHGGSINELKDIGTVIGYVTFLQSCVSQMEYYDLPKEIVKDLEYATKKGILCFYLTTVLNMLLRDIHNQHPRMVQGFFNYDSTFFGFVKATTQTGIHAFTVLGDGVIDPCFYIQNTDYPTEEVAIMGEVPSDIAFYGWYEPVLTEEMYIQRFAKKFHKGSVTHFKYVHITGYHDFILNTLAEIK